MICVLKKDYYAYWNNMWRRVDNYFFYH